MARSYRKIYLKYKFLIWKILRQIWNLSNTVLKKLINNTVLKKTKFCACMILASINQSQWEFVEKRLEWQRWRP